MATKGKPKCNEIACQVWNLSVELDREVFEPSRMAVMNISNSFAEKWNVRTKTEKHLQG